MTELEKCMAGEPYDCHDKIFLDFKARTRKLLKEYQAMKAGLKIIKLMQ